MSILATAKPASQMSQQDGIKVLVYGPAGAGKTRLCATTGCPSETLILSAESGLLSIKDSKALAIAITNLDQLGDVYRALRNEDHSYKWICLDSISEIAEVCLADEKKKAKDPRQAYGEMAGKMISLIKAFRDLPLNVYMSCKQGTIEDEGMTLFAPSMPGRKLAGDLPYLFDEVFRMVVQRTEEGEVKRALRTDNDGKSIAKDRSGCLAVWEQPNLQHIHNKIYGAK